MPLVKVPDNSGNTMTLISYKGVYGSPQFNEEALLNMDNFPLREDDIMLCSYSKSGCHWMWEILRLLTSGTTLTKTETIDKESYMMEWRPCEMYASLPSPRILNNHMTFDMQPTDLLIKKPKVVFIYRNFKDVAVSFYHHHLGIHEYGYHGNFESYLNRWISGLTDNGTPWKYTLGWEKGITDNPELPVFLTSYEDLKKNPLLIVKKLSLFLGHTYSEEFLQKVCDVTDFSAMKQRKGPNSFKNKDGNPVMYRKDCYIESDQVEVINKEVLLSLECDNILKAKGTPKECFRPEYLIVSDLIQQQWCEQQLLYNLDEELYLSRAISGEKVIIQETPEIKIVKKRGSDIHLERELQIQVPVQVNVGTEEDIWAVKLMNLHYAVSSFHKGSGLAREIPVFGAPFDGETFLHGIIDELQFNLNEYTTIITELKTKKNKFPPKTSQIKKDKYQVGLYAKLFNEMVVGKISRQVMADKLKLNMDLELSSDVQKHIKESKINLSNKTETLGGLIDVVLTKIQSLPCINYAKLEYVHQDTMKVISSMEFSLDFILVADMYNRHIEWWQGKRGTIGVDIEECWKCSHCQFSELCEWREVMAKKYSQKS